MIKLFENKKIVIGTGIIFVSSIAIFAVSNFYNPVSLTQEVATIKTADYKDKFSGFEKNIKIKTGYLGDQSNDQYIVQYTFNKNDIDYIDAEIIVNKKTENFEATISGLPTTAKLSLLIDDKFVESSIPVDWAGRLSLVKQNPDNKTICLGIDDIKRRQKSIICHNPNYTAERSVAS